MPNEKIRAIITGATGMVGEGVLHECLNHPDVEKVLIINRRPSGISHPKLTEIIHKDFFDFTTIENQLGGYNAAFLCLGVTSLGLNEEQYNHLTYDLTVHVAEKLAKHNPGMTCCYVSGAGTGNVKPGNSKLNMWVRVKNKTENALMNLSFKKAYMFRPAYIQPTKGLKNTQKPYYAISWMYPVLRPLFPNYVCTLKEIGLAMINTVYKGPENPILEVKDIVELAAR